MVFRYPAAISPIFLRQQSSLLQRVAEQVACSRGALRWGSAAGGHSTGRHSTRRHALARRLTTGGHSTRGHSTWGHTAWWHSLARRHVVLGSHARVHALWRLALHCGALLLTRIASLVHGGTLVHGRAAVTLVVLVGWAATTSSFSCHRIGSNVVS